MKKASLLIALIFATGIVLGHGGSHQALPEPGHTPGSMMYGIEQAYESASLALTFDKEAKVRKKVSFAQERLSESAHLAKENKTRLAGKASENYIQSINQAQVMANKTGNESLIEKVENERKDNKNVLKDLENVLPSEASKGVKNALKRMNNSKNRAPVSSEEDISGFVATGRAIE